MTAGFTEKLKRYLYLLLIPALGVPFSWTALMAVNGSNHLDSDFFTFWLSGHLATLGQDPYQSDIWLGWHHRLGATWMPNATFIYPLPVAWIFAPLGLLSLAQAFVAWIILSQFLIVLSLALLLRLYPTSQARSHALPLLLGVGSFYPAILALLNGQFSPLLLIILAAIGALWEKHRWEAGGLLLPLLALKPNLGIPIIGLLAIYLIVRRRTRALATSVLFGAALLLLSWLKDPQWVGQFWTTGNTKLSQIFGFAPTVWGISAFLCQHRALCSIGYGLIVSALLLAAYVWLIVKNRDRLSPLWAISLALPVTLLSTPTAWPYDQLLLLIPIVVITMGLAKAGWAFLPTALIFLAFDILAFLLIGLAMRVGMGIWNVTLPFSVLVALIGFLLTKRSTLEPVRAG